MQKRVFLVGAMKAGTTTLHDYLVQHEQVFTPSIKEPQYISWTTRFDGDFSVAERSSLRQAKSVIPIRDTIDYEKLYQDARLNQYILDSSVFNLPHPPAASFIKNNYPNAKIIIILRDMVDRAFSSFTFQKSKGAERAETFSLAVTEELMGKRDNMIYPWRNIYCSRYKQQIIRYMELFNENLLILKFDDLVTDPNKVMADVYEHLELDYSPLSVNISNRTMAPPKNRFNSNLSQLIYTPNIYKDSIKKFFPSKIRKISSSYIKKNIRRTNKEILSYDEKSKLKEIFFEDEMFLKEQFGISWV